MNSIPFYIFLEMRRPEYQKSVLKMECLNRNPPKAPFLVKKPHAVLFLEFVVFRERIKFLFHSANALILDYIIQPHLDLLGKKINNTKSKPQTKQRDAEIGGSKSATFQL